MCWCAFQSSSPHHAWFRPSRDGAVQPHTLFLPHSVWTGLDHKLWRVHQAVLVQTLVILFVLMNLQACTQIRYLTHCKPYTWHSYDRLAKFNDAKCLVNSTRNLQVKWIGLLKLVKTQNVVSAQQNNILGYHGFY